MRLHKGKSLGNGTKTQMSMREKGRVKINFLPKLPLSWEREKPWHLHYLAYEEYAPGNHLPVAHHEWICHPSDSFYFSEHRHNINQGWTVVTSLSILPPYSAADKTIYIRAMALKLVLQDTASIQSRETPYSSIELLWAKQSIYKFVHNVVYSDTIRLLHTSVLTETRWDNGNPDCWKPGRFQFECIYLFKPSWGFPFTLHVRGAKPTKKECLEISE